MCSLYIYITNGIWTMPPFAEKTDGLAIFAFDGVAIVIASPILAAVIVNGPLLVVLRIGSMNSAGDVALWLLIAAQSSLSAIKATHGPNFNSEEPLCLGTLSRNDGNSMF